MGQRRRVHQIMAECTTAVERPQWGDRHRATAQSEKKAGKREGTERRRAG